MNKKISILLLIILLGSFVFATALCAQEAAQEGGSAIETIASTLFGKSLVKQFKDGGWAMWPLLALLIWGVGIAIWKLLVLVKGRINVEKFLEQVVPLIKDGKFKQAIEYVETQKGPVANVVRAGLLKSDSGIEAVEKAIENAAVVEMSFLDRGFNELSTTINLAPMMGFLGTLLGMITAFDDITNTEVVDAGVVAGGIKIALITSAAGLIIAIPVQFANNIFLTMVDSIVVDMQKATEKVIDTLTEK
ncbi:MAG: biopolymer transporter ExbB [Candidatus Cloacimonetes bacterium 4572_65]|nr:MAG: biopolymer transporter ExbB [Candidatus Cloacimonetes bacterium 4572_65]